jgi:hypothetical protein
VVTFGFAVQYLLTGRSAFSDVRVEPVTVAGATGATAAEDPGAETGDAPRDGAEEEGERDGHRGEPGTGAPKIPRAAEEPASDKAAIGGD